jgi:hypothetical protein
MYHLASVETRGLSNLQSMVIPLIQFKLKAAMSKYDSPGFL